MHISKYLSKHRAFIRIAFSVILTATVFLICFTSRLIPVPSSDRAIFISVAEYLLSGSRLYVDVYDNKDPLFFYAVSAQRLLGPAAEYLFELSLVAVSAGTAYAIARFVDRIDTANKGILLIAVPLLLTGVFWLPGYTTLPGTALSLLACALFLRQRMLLAGGCIGLVAFTKLIMLPLPVVFCFSYELVVWKAGLSRPRFGRMTVGFVAVSAIVTAILFLRGEAFGYLQAQKNNFFYSNGLLVDNSTFITSFTSHLRTMFLVEKEKLVILISLIASMVFSILLAAQPSTAKRTRAFIVGSLSTCVMSVVVLGLTGIWDHHLQLLYFSHTLMLICLAIGLGERLTNASFAIAIVICAIALSGTVSKYQYAAYPDQVAERLVLRLAELAEASPETKALRAVYPNGRGFARLGKNTYAIPYGADNDRLICPEFGQYPFHSPERFDDILECVKTAPTLVVDSSFERLIEAPTWWPIDAQKEVILDNWNDFVTAGENLLRTQYACQQLEDVRVCDSLDSLGK